MDNFILFYFCQMRDLKVFVSTHDPKLGLSSYNLTCDLSHLLRPFEKFTQVTFIQHLTGRQYSEKVAENCIASWKLAGFYSGEEAKAIETFLEVFKDQTFPHGSSVSFTQSPPHGSSTISFSKDESIPQVGNEVMVNKLLGEAILESIIGKHGVSPAARQRLPQRLSDLLTEKPELLGVGKPTNQVEVGGN
ncbi:hypothetical protein DVH24_024061 [Malus domestica]|uniref:Chalcone-flavonone isomerase family protein n=1 Tax=Malus domestica TaxID=3750 RepID=A0A498JHU3_MALDO|nr:hypothetical protein DVH24_024061 [Malus domestica]